jgi:RNA polymerase sigma-70 factor, ECF subfamily
MTSGKTGFPFEHTSRFLKDHFRPLGEYPDGVLVQLAKAGDRGAFGELVNRNLAFSRKIAAPIVRNSTTIDDIVLQSFLKAFEHLHQFDGQAKFSSWLARIITNECYQNLRSARVLMTSFNERDHPPEAPKSLGRDPETCAARAEIAALVAGELRRVPTQLREALLLQLEGMSTAEMAARLGVSQPAVKSRVRRARQHLRTRLSRHLPAMSCLLL